MAVLYRLLAYLSGPYMGSAFTLGLVWLNICTGIKCSMAHKGVKTGTRLEVHMKNDL